MTIVKVLSKYRKFARIEKEYRSAIEQLSDATNEYMQSSYGVDCSYLSDMACAESPLGLCVYTGDNLDVCYFCGEEDPLPF